MKVRRILLLAVAFVSPLAAVPDPGPFGVSPAIVHPGPPQIPSDPDRWLPWRIFTWRDGVKTGASALVQDVQGYVWAGTPDGLLRYNGQRWQLIAVPGKPYTIFAILGPRDGSLWIGKPPDHQFYRLRNGVWTVFDQRNGIPPGEAEVLAESVEGGRSTLWAGTSEGLSRCRGDVCTEVTALQGHIVRVLVPTRSEDGRPALWIGTSRGLLRLDDAGTDHPRLSPLFDDPAVLSNLSIRSLAETLGKDGKRSLWVGTELGVARLRDGIWTRYDHDSGFPSGPILKLVACREADGTPFVWAGSLRSGLFRFADDGRWQLVDVRSGLPANFVFSLLSTGAEGTDPDLWVTTPATLARLGRERWHSTDTRSGLPSDMVTGLGEVTFPDGRRSFWIGTVGGMVRLTSRGWERYSPMPGASDAVIMHAVNSRERDGTSSLWLGRLDGLFHFAHGQWSRFDSRTSPLPHDWIVSLLEVPGPRGSEIWAGTRAGVVRYAEGTLDGLPRWGRRLAGPGSAHPRPFVARWRLPHPLGQHREWHGTIRGRDLAAGKAALPVRSDRRLPPSPGRRGWTMALGCRASGHRPHAARCGRQPPGTLPGDGGLFPTDLQPWRHGPGPGGLLRPDLRLHRRGSEASDPRSRKGPGRRSGGDVRHRRRPSQHGFLRPVVQGSSGPALGWRHRGRRHPGSGTASAHRGATPRRAPAPRARQGGGPRAHARAPAPSCATTTTAWSSNSPC